MLTVELPYWPYLLELVGVVVVVDTCLMIYFLLQLLAQGKDVVPIISAKTLLATIAHHFLFFSPISGAISVCFHLFITMIIVSMLKIA